MQEVRDDANHAPAIVFHRFRHRAHQAQLAAAIDKAKSCLRHQRAKANGRFREARIIARRGAAINADMTDGR